MSNKFLQAVLYILIFHVWAYENLRIHILKIMNVKVTIYWPAKEISP